MQSEQPVQSSKKTIRNEGRARNDAILRCFVVGGGRKAAIVYGVWRGFGKGQISTPQQRPPPGAQTLL